MRLTTVLLIASMLQVSASGFGQRLNYVNKGATIIELFKEIKKQTSYNVIWPEQDVNTNASIRANFKNTQIVEALDQSFKGLNLSYVINGKTIIIKAIAPSILDKTKSVIQRIFQDINAHGYVVGDQNLPLRGATVKIKGSNRFTTTNDKGAFSLANVPKQSILVISYLGYQTQEIKASTDIATIRLLLNTDNLEEVTINAGYYSVKERELTGNISKMTSSTIEKQPVNNLLLALQGRIAGLQVIQQNGIPGGGMVVRIRGQNSLKSGNDPLYIVDGVPYPSTGISGGRTNLLIGESGLSPLSLFSPADIQSIEVLKDADATAIYGSRGANGVILITTKRGQLGVTKVNAGVSHGFSEVGHRIKLLNTEQYFQMRREAYKNDGLKVGAIDYDLNGTWDANKYTDWQQELISGTAQTTNATLNLTGGSAKGNYLIAGNYYKEGTVFPGAFKFERAGIRSNINIGNIDGRFNASFTASFYHTESNLPSIDLTSNIFLPPNAPDLYDQEGQLNWANNTVLINPMASLLDKSESLTDNLVGNLSLSYRILDKLTFKTVLGYSTIKRQEFRKSPLIAYPPAFNYTSTARESHFGNNYTNNFIFEPQLTYVQKFSRSKVDALVGLSMQNNNSQVGVIRAANFTSDDLMENIGSAATITNVQNEYVEYHYLAVFGRLNYSLDNKYFFNLTARRDGSSRFGPGRQFANFGAVGASWLFTEETLVKENLSFLSFGKLRASYGITGNDQIQNYAYLQLWNNSAVYQNNSTLTPSLTGPNADFAWETNRKLETAVQLGFLKDKITAALSFYRNRSSNQLLPQSLPLSTGLINVLRNLPAEIQNTGWELEADAKLLNGQSWSWSARLNLTRPVNKLLSYPNLETSADAVNYKVGEPLSILKAYHVTVNTQSGVYMFEDKNSSGTIDDGDRYLIEFLGQSFYGGLQNEVGFKQFRLDFHLAFTKQKGRNYVANTPLVPGRWTGGTKSNQFVEVLSRWQQPSEETSIQKFSTTTANRNLFTSASNYGDITVSDASFIRLRNISLTYSLPKKMLSALKIQSASIILQGQNLFTLTNYVGLDPETQSVNLPPLRTLAMGLNVTF